MSVIYAFFGSLGFSILFNVRGKKVLWASLGGALGWLIYRLTAGLFDTDIPQYFFATIAIAIYAEIMARVQKAPTTIYLAIAFIPLVPGGGIYYTMEHLLYGNNELFAQTGLHTLSVAGALAMGLVVVSSIFRIVTAQRRHLRERLKPRE